jgi:23S rRNA (guanosine2251-2'-O)-methyltransferase
LLLVLDQISDSRNFGVIFRTAECASIKGIIGQKAVSATIYCDTAKTSTGSVFNIPICKVQHIKHVIILLQASRIKKAFLIQQNRQNVYNYYNNKQEQRPITSFSSIFDNRYFYYFQIDPQLPVRGLYT